MSEQQANNRSMNVSYKEPALPRSSLVIWIVCIGLAIFLTWAWLFNLEEVSTGTGKVIPSSKEQTIQSSIIAGSLCESGDVFTQDSLGIPQKVSIPTPQVEDLIVIHNCGAYGASMSSNYNSKLLSPEFLLRKSKYEIIRKKQSFEQLFQLEVDL